MAVAAIAAAGCLAGVLGLRAPESESQSALALANIEALSKDEDGCHDTNGYRRWDTTGDGFQSESEFYDCCTKLRHGYNPEGNCN